MARMLSRRGLRNVRVVYEGGQTTNSHAIRAAELALSAVSTKLIVCASGGNFGAAMAYAARVRARRAVVFVPEGTPPEKVCAISRHQGQIVPHAGSLADAAAEAAIYAKEHGGYFLDGAASEFAVLGAATLAADIELMIPSVTDCLVPTGGGGLLAGISAFFAGGVRVVSVETEKTGSMHAALAAGKPVSVEVGGLAASALGAPIVGRAGFDAATRWGVPSVLVTDEEAGAAQRWLWENHRLPAECGAAVGLAAVLQKRYRIENRNVVVVVTGANLSAAELATLTL